MTVPALTGAAPLTPITPLTHLFRHSLRDGRVHPLLHIVQRYRQEMPR